MMNPTRLLLTLFFSLALGGGCATNNDPFLPNVQAATSHTGEPSDAKIVPATGQRPAQANSSTVQVIPAAVAREPASASLTQEGRGNSDYRIGPEDLLDIQVFGVSELSRTVRVSSRGFISIPATHLRRDS